MIKDIKNVLKEVRALKEKNKNVLLIDTVELLNNLEFYECNGIKSEMIINYYYNVEPEYKNADNSYNWNGFLSNEIDFRTIEYNGVEYMLLKVHLYGDIRANYTNYTVLRFENDYDFYEVLGSTTTNNIIEVGGFEYAITTTATSEYIEIYNISNGKKLNECYCYELEDIRKHIEEMEV